MLEKAHRLKSENCLIFFYWTGFTGLTGYFSPPIGRDCVSPLSSRRRQSNLAMAGRLESGEEKKSK